MQNELRASHPQLDIEIIGINEADPATGCTGTPFSAGNDDITNNATASSPASAPDIPWLQDVDLGGNCASDVWHDKWGVNYRDVVILDGDNVQVAVYNLTTPPSGSGCSLADAACYSGLKQLLVSSAQAP